MSRREQLGVFQNMSINLVMQFHITRSFVVERAIGLHRNPIVADVKLEMVAAWEHVDICESQVCACDEISHATELIARNNRAVDTRCSISAKPPLALPAPTLAPTDAIVLADGTAAAPQIMPKLASSSVFCDSRALVAAGGIPAVGLESSSVAEHGMPSLTVKACIQRWAFSQTCRTTYT